MGDGGKDLGWAATKEADARSGDVREDHESGALSFPLPWPGEGCSSGQERFQLLGVFLVAYRSVGTLIEKPEDFMG